MAAAGKNPYAIGAAKGTAKGAAKSAGAAARRMVPASAAAAAPEREFTEEEKIEKLRGYVLINREDWPFIKTNTHVRYIETEEKGGKFKVGGFVQSAPYVADPKDIVASQVLRLKSGFYNSATGARPFMWSVKYDDIEAIYAKGSGTDLTIIRDLESVVKGLNANIGRLASYVKKLEKRVAALEGS